MDQPNLYSGIMLDPLRALGYSNTMSKIVTDLSLEQLKRLLAIKEQMAALESELASLLGGTAAAPTPARRKGGKRVLSEAGRQAIRAAQKARWAKKRGVTRTPAKAKPRRKLSAAGRARLAALARARWKAARAEGKTTL